MRLAISFDGLRHLIDDLHKRGLSPAALMVSESDKRDLKQEIMAGSKIHSEDAEREGHDLRAIGFIGGVPIVSHKSIDPGKARVILKPAIADRNADVVVR